MAKTDTATTDLSAADWADLAKMTIDDLPEVVLFPKGTYYAHFDGPPSFKPSANEAWMMINYRIKFEEPIEDFEGDEDALEAYGSIRNQVRIHSDMINVKTYTDKNGEQVDQATVDRRKVEGLKKHMEWLASFGIPKGSFEEMVGQIAKTPCLVTMGHEIDNRDQSVRERIAFVRPIPKDGADE